MIASFRISVPVLFRLFSIAPVTTPGSEISRGLRISVWEGSCFSAMLALTDTFAVAAAVYLNAPAIAIGILAGLPLFAGSLGQLLVANFFRSRGNLKRHVMIGTGSQGFFLVLIALSGYLPDAHRAWAYVSLFTLQGFSGNIVAGLWMAWMSNLVEPALRSRYFAWRNRIISMAQLACGIGAGAMAFRHTVENSSWLFFLLIFCAAAMFRFVSTALLSRQYEHPRPLHARPVDQTVNVPGMNSDLIFFSIATALMQGAVMIGSPFFNLWYTRDLNFTFFTLSLSTASMVLGSIIALPIWSKLSDRYGHWKLLVCTGFLIAVVPLPFLFTDNTLLLILYNLYTGVCWSGYNLSSFNHLLSLTQPASSERQISLSIALTGIAVFICSLLGGFLAPKLPHLFEWRLQTLFFVSMIARVAVFLSFFVKMPRTRTDTLSKRAERLAILRRVWERV